MEDIKIVDVFYTNNNIATPAFSDKTKQVFYFVKSS